MSRVDSAQEPDEPAPRSGTGLDGPGPNPYLENYLDHVYARLVGILPYSQRMEAKAELREHLLSLAEAKQAEGLSGDDALAAAIRQMGSPGRLAREWKRQKRATLTQGSPWPLKKSISFAVAVFFGVTALSLPLLLPPFLGYADPIRALGFGYVDWWALLMPVLAGGLIGYHVRGRSYAVAFYALFLMIVLAAIPYLGNFPTGGGESGYGGFSSLYELFCILYGLYGLPLTFIGVALGQGLSRLKERLLLRPIGYRQMSLT